MKRAAALARLHAHEHRQLWLGIVMTIQAMIVASSLTLLYLGGQVVAGLASACSLLALGLLLMVNRAWQRQRRDLQLIEQGHLSLHEAHEIADIGSISVELDTGRWSSSDIFDLIAGIDAGYPRERAHLMRLLGARQQATIRRCVNMAVATREPVELAQLVIQRPDGAQRWVHVRGKVRVDGEAVTLVCTVQDITERKHAEDEIRRLAYYDSLTGLPNRRLLLDRLGAAMADNQGRARHGALLLIDLDHFRVLNETQGHNRGDQLLTAVAQRLCGVVQGDASVARLGGDEFAVLVANLASDPELARCQAAAMAELLRAALSAPFDLGGFIYRGSPSIGITLFAGQTLEIGELAKRVDTAMYQAKAAGRNAVRFFDPAMQAVAEQRLAMEQDLRQSLADGDFELHYQVQVDGGGQARGAEVLLRWRHPVQGMISPAQFIPLAEESGLILPLGLWVLQSACAQLARWAHDPSLCLLSLAVNVSARQFIQSDFVEQVLKVLADSGADPRRLKLELTEGLLLDNTESVIATIGALKRAGICISLDDFGTGFSSLSYLKRLPLDQLKIDQAFVRDLLTDANDVAIVRTIVALGRSLGMEVIAEGVETAAQRDALAAAGCHAYQGYYYGRPVPLAQFEAALRPRPVALRTMSVGWPA